MTTSANSSSFESYTATEKRRVYVHCRRGMLELDMILLPYFERVQNQLSRREWQDLEVLLEEADPDLYTWLMGYGVPEQPALLAVVQAIRQTLAL